jgi:hypothetical protein
MMKGSCALGVPLKTPEAAKYLGEGLLRVGGAGKPVSGKGSASAIKLDFLDGIGNVNEVVGDLIVDIIGSVQGTGVQVSNIAETGLGVNFRVLSRYAESKCRQYHGEKKKFLHCEFSLNSHRDSS